MVAFTPAQHFHKQSPRPCVPGPEILRHHPVRFETGSPPLSPHLQKLVWPQPLFPQGAYYTQPVYAAQPHVIHHTTVVQPNSIPSAIYPAPVAAPRTNGVAMGMVAGTTMAMSAGKGSIYVSVHPLPPGAHNRVVDTVMESAVA